MSQNPVAFLGAGVHCVLGDDVASCLAALRERPASPAVLENNITGECLPIPYKLLSGEPLGDSGERLIRTTARVAEQALAEAGLNAEERRRSGLFLGSSSFDICAQEAAYRAELDAPDAAIALRGSSIGDLANELVGRLGLRGPDYSFNTACTASANALAAAVTQVAAGRLEHALVLGVELYNDVSALGFQGLGLLTSSVMKPFDSERDGLVLGESVAGVVVGRAPGGSDLFSLRGSASLSDTHSITASQPEGDTIARVMREALADAGLTPADIDAIKVHGTASLSNDEAEAAGMHQVFAALPPVCALKPYLGHTLGACGVTELVLFYHALQAGFLIGTPGISSSAGDLGVCLTQAPSPRTGGVFLLNYFGFGGNNTSLVISGGTP
ncbi:MAG: beta-ketoacyl synthase [Halioglobus sp.]|nr:beta-ketoacyl synthase [Halioglobus sp.]